MTEQTVATEQTDEAKTERSNALRKAYGLANSELRETYRSEFEALYKKHAEALGVDYTPRLTPEQKAEQEFQNLLAQFPHLAEKVQPAAE